MNHLADSNEISFDVRRDEAVTIGRIVQRAVTMEKARGQKINGLGLELSMDITACHANGNRLKLTSLLEADDFNFRHDVFGIRRHLNRETGKLENHFRPRFSA